MELLLKESQIMTKPSQFEGFAKSFWKPTLKEKKALEEHSYVDELDRVDEIWKWLNSKHGDVQAVDAPHSNPPEKYSYSELEQLISELAKAFNYFGIQSNDVVAVFAENSPRWLIVDQAIMRSGACNAVRGASAPIQELRYILEDCSASALVVQSAELWTQLGLSEEHKQQLKVVVQLEGEPIDQSIYGWDSFGSIALDKFREKDLSYIENNNVDKSSVATILYTSGTTGKPKGVPLTHSNLLHQIRSLACVANPGVGDPVLSVLPIWHAYERSAEYYFFSCGCTQTYTSIKKLKNDLPKVRPVIMATVPRLWEAIKDGFDEVLKGMPKYSRFFLKSALSNSCSYKLALRTVQGLLIDKPTKRQLLVAMVQLFVRWPIHQSSALVLWPKVVSQITGGNLLYPINGGGAIAPHVDLFFEAVGIELLVGYGLTETSPVVSCRRPWRNIRGSSGTPLPETEFRIVDPETGSPKKFLQKGRVLVKGPQVMSGYLGKPDATSKVLDSEGWFDTGDIGKLLPDGSIVLTGRAKDTIVLSSGENIEPGPLEEALLASPLISQVMLLGQDEKQLSALVVPNVDPLFLWLQSKGVFIEKSLLNCSEDANLKRLLRSEINFLLQTREGSRPDERVGGIAFVLPFSIENGLLTQTLKQRRNKILERDSSAIASIYGR